MSLIASHKIRFIGIMMAFTFNMIVLMVSQDLILIFIAWEMIGIISCLLIGYYNNRIEANRSGLKAIFYNRVGDISLFYFIVSVINLLNDISISLFSFLYLIVNSDSFQLFFLITSIMGKSAQIGFQPWLLDAMEGPTPVSALLHSATLVTAGIILLYKNRFILYFNNSLAIIVLIVGGISCLLNSVSSIHYIEVKRIIAFSTCTHISLIIMIFSIQIITNVQDISFTHLFYHGWSKSVLFLLIGYLITLVYSQDIRLVGSLYQHIPILFVLVNISLLIIFGFPGSFLAYSKDMILEFGLISIYGYNIIILFFIIIIVSQGYSLSILLYLLYNYSFYYSIHNIWNHYTISNHINYKIIVK
jgi:NADH-quinone oxidoreductase subunit L